MATAWLRQPSVRIPLVEVPTDRTDLLGVIGLRCRLPLWLDIEGGGAKPMVRFVVDSGASYSFINLDFARSRGLSLPPLEPEVTLPLRTGQGIAETRVRPGRIRAWWTAERHGHPFDWPFLFRVDAPLDVPPVLGLGGVVRVCRWTFDGGYTPTSPHGYLTIDDVR